MHLKYTEMSDDIPVCKLHIKHVCSEMKGDGRGKQASHNNEKKR